MSAPDEMSRGQRQKSEASQAQLSFLEEAFLELFKLLEQYAPVWYTGNITTRPLPHCSSSKNLGHSRRKPRDLRQVEGRHH